MYTPFMDVMTWSGAVFRPGMDVIRAIADGMLDVTIWSGAFLHHSRLKIYSSEPEAGSYGKPLRGLV